MSAADPNIDAFVAAARYVARLPVGDRGTVFLPSGTAVLLERTEAGVWMHHAATDDEIALWMAEERGNA